VEYFPTGSSSWYRASGSIRSQSCRRMTRKTLAIIAVLATADFVAAWHDEMQGHEKIRETNSSAP
jgi:hypothetical protein